MLIMLLKICEMGSANVDELSLRSFVDRVLTFPFTFLRLIIIVFTSDGVLGCKYIEFWTIWGRYLRKALSFLFGKAFLRAMPIPVKWLFNVSAILVESVIVALLW